VKIDIGYRFLTGTFFKSWYSGLLMVVAVPFFMTVTSNAMALSPSRLLGMPEPVTPVSKEVLAVHDFLMWIMAAIVIFVFMLLMYVIVRYNRKSNPKAANFSHNVPLEIAWTIAPVLILVILGFKSVPLIFTQEKQNQIEPDLIVKITGNQWFWSYEYPDHGISFDSFMLSEREILERGMDKKLWKKAVDRPMVVPEGANVIIQVTASDVIHSWSVPAFGVKIDGIPGRLNQSWLQVDRTGDFYGHCYELCGVGHSYMPVGVRVVTQEQFESWLVDNGASLVDNSAASTLPSS